MNAEASGDGEDGAVAPEDSPIPNPAKIGEMVVEAGSFKFWAFGSCEPGISRAPGWLGIVFFDLVDLVPNGLI